MTDIVDSLRHDARERLPYLEEAADEIESLRSRLERYEEALRGSLDYFDFYLSATHTCGDPYAECPLHDAHKDHDIAGHVLRIRRALADDGGGGEDD